MVVLQPIKVSSGPPPSSRVNLSLKRGRARRALSLLGNNNSRLNLHLAESLLTISAEEFTNKWNFDPIQGVPLPSGRFQWTPVTSVTPSGPAAVTSSDPTKAVTSCDRSSSSVDIPNPAEDKSQDQTTCVTLPSPVSVPKGSCQVSADQSSDLTRNQNKSSETEIAKAKKEEENNTHNCCPRTCACSSDSDNKNTDSKMNKSSEKDICVKVSSSSNNSKGTTEAADSGIDSDDSVVEESTLNAASPTKTDSLHQSPSKLRQTCITEFVRPKKLSTFSALEGPLGLHPSSSKKRPAPSLQDQLNQPPHKKVLLHLRA